MWNTKVYDTNLICGECGTGNYGTAVSADYICVDCGHLMNARDFVLDEGESLRLVRGVLTVATEGV